VPLNTPDPRYADYFAELKRRIEANWTYPQDASRRGQSGQGLVGFVLRKNGSVREVDIVQSSGVEILDRYLVNAIRLASPMPPIPDRISETTLPVVFAFTYTLYQGVRVFGFQ
jgi:protein TonB